MGHLALPEACYSAVLLLEMTGAGLQPLSGMLLSLW
jgi:hypothetical protein